MSVDDDNLPRPEKDREIATTRDGIDITRSYTGPLLIPSDRVLRQRGGGDLAIYEQVLSEPQVASTFLQRRLAVVAHEWRVEPASDRRVDKKAAEHVRQQLHRVGFDQRTDRMLYGVFYGFAVAELLYDVQDGMIGWQAIKVRNRRRFRFTPDGALRMLTFSNMHDGVELPKEKFWHFATGADHDDEPYGLGLGHWCYWPTLFKRQDVKFWLGFVEKFAAPTGVGRYESGTGPEERAKLLAAVRAIQHDSGIILPKGMEVELLEAARAGSADYQALHDTMDATIAKVVIGQTASSQGTPGKLGNDALQGDVREDLIRADADLVCESLNLGPVRWLTRWNFPDADPPRVYRVMEQPEDASARAERDAKVYAMGFKPTLAYVQEVYGGEWTERAAAPAADPAAAPSAPSAAFAAPAVGTGDPPAQMAALLADDAASAVTPWLDRIRELVERADSFDAVRDGLAVLIPDLSLDQYAAAMATASSAARLAGRYEVTAERDGAGS